jgi:hypothetical protein
MDEVIEAFAVEEDDDEVSSDNKLDAARLLSSCHGIIVANKNDNSIDFIHTTAYQFFVKVSSDTDVNTDIARACLLYLNLQPFRSEILATFRQLGKNFRSMPFLDYASCYWGDHIRNKDAEVALQGHILSLLQNGCVRSNAFLAFHFPAVLSSIPTGHEPLHISAFWNLEHTTLLLLQDGGDASVTDSQKRTPLHWACSGGHLGVATILIHHDAKVDAVDSQGWTPLFWAAFSGHIGLVRLLLEHGAYHLHCSELGWTALHWAIARREMAVAEILINHHASTPSWEKTQPPEFLRNLTYQKAPYKEYVRDMVRSAESAANIGVISIFDALAKHLGSTGSLSNDDEYFNEIWSAEQFDQPISNPWH